MVDMMKTIAPKTDQLNFDDMIGGKTLTINITDVKGNDAKDQPISVHFEGDNGKPYKPCLSMRRVMVNVWGRDGKSYIGKSMTLFGDPTVVFGGIKVGGIRISHMSGITEPVTMALTASKAQRKPYQVKPLAAPAAQPDMNPADIPEAGKEAASKGTAAYNVWCNARTAADKVHIKPLHPEWKKLAAEVDAAAGAA